jgi:hypothetical protein
LVFAFRAAAERVALFAGMAVFSEAGEADGAQVVFLHAGLLAGVAVAGRVDLAVNFDD